jgi:sulfur-oxidizing protein SoxY
MERRSVISGLVGSSLLSVFGGLVGLMPTAAHGRAAAAFDAKTAKEGIAALFKDGAVEVSDKLRLIAPEIAENGTVVPLTIESSLSNLEAIAVFAPENPRALVATYRFTPASSPPIDLRVKLAKSQKILVVAQADGKLYSASRQVGVSVGGCGG